MAPASRLDDLIRQIYVAATEPESWPTFLELLRRSTQGIGADLVLADMSQSRSYIHAGVGNFGAEFQEGYSAFSANDPFFVQGRDQGLFRAGVIALGEQVVPMSALERTDFHHDFGRHHEYYGGVTAILEASDVSAAALSVSRSKHRSFSRLDCEILRLLLPHLQRALQVHRRIAAAECRSSELAASLDQVATGAIVVNRRGQSVFVNAAALRVLRERDGLILERGELKAADPNQTGRLRQLIATAVITSEAATADSGGAMLLKRPSGKLPLQVIITPILAGERQQAPADGRALVLVADPAQSSVADPTLLRRLFGFTRAESSVAVLLLQDKSAQQIADECAVSINTVRFHLRHLLSKTGTRRQSELVRTLTTALQRRPHDGPD